MNRGLGFIVLLLLLGAGPAARPLPPVVINRSDVFDAVHRFAEAYAAHPPPAGAARSQVHRAYDQAVYQYLSGKSINAIQQINAITDAIDPAPSRPEVRALLRSLQVQVSPVIGWRSRPGIFRARVARMYRVNTPLPMDLRLVIREDTPAARVILDSPVKIEESGPPFSLTRAGPDAPMGSYVIELVGPDQVREVVDRWTVVEVSLEVLKHGIATQLISFRPEAPEMIQAAAAVSSRNALLTDRPDRNNAAQYLPDPLLLARSVQSETENLLMGKNPFADRRGDTWRTIQAGMMQIPARIYAPPQAATRQPMPLVIALGGGGGDENTFMDYVGNGKIRKLADQYGFIVVTPNSFWLTNNLAAFDAILETMSMNYAIDKSRVYVIGHSSGAGIAAQTVGRQPHRVAAMTLISGGDVSGVTRLPRTRFYNGGADLFYPPAQAQALMATATEAKLPIEQRRIDDAGHLLLADDVLDEAITWMLQPPANAALSGG